MLELENLQQSMYCICGEFLPEYNINEYCNSCNKSEKTCLGCERTMLGCNLSQGLCWDCLQDESSVTNENMKCNFCGQYSSTPICWTCEHNPELNAIPDIYDVALNDRPNLIREVIDKPTIHPDIYPRENDHNINLIPAVKNNQGICDSNPGHHPNLIREIKHRPGVLLDTYKCENNHNPTLIPEVKYNFGMYHFKPNRKPNLIPDIKNASNGGPGIYDFASTYKCCGRYSATSLCLKCKRDQQ